MLPVFTNPLGFYALLGIPALLAIHFLQHRSKKVTTSTLFLIEALTPESRTGRVWERIRNSLALWMQILCILLLAWVLAKPRWVQENSWQTVVFVMDDSMRMQAFKKEAIEAVSNDIGVIKSTGIPTHWVLMASSSRRAPLYRGDDDARILDALEKWTPNAGDHDPVPALRTAQTVVAENGVSRFITHSKTRTEPWQSTVGVGRPIDNVGFVGIIPEEQAEGALWRVAVKNNSPKPQTREIEFLMGGGSTKQLINMNPHSVAELKVGMPPEVDSLQLRLTPDGFGKDDTLPVVRHVPKPLFVHLATDGESIEFFRKLVSSLPGAELSPASAAKVYIISASDMATLPPGPAIILPRETTKVESTQIVTAEDHELTRDLGWGGLLYSKVGSLNSDAPKQVLLWSGSEPLAWLQQQKLVLNWDWKTSNADRIPAPVLLLRRFLEYTQAQTPGFWSGNVASGAKLAVPGATVMRFAPVSGAPMEKSYSGSLPDDAGIIEIFGDKEKQNLLFKGAVYPADARQGDFSQCSTFTQGDLNQQNILERISNPDPLVPLWLALAGSALVIAWIPGKRERGQHES